MNAPPRAASAFVLTALFTLTAAAEPALKREPGPGNLRPGERVLVDDGTCPRGQIKEVIGGSNLDRGRSQSSGAQRVRRCVPR